MTECNLIRKNFVFSLSTKLLICVFFFNQKVSLKMILRIMIISILFIKCSYGKYFYETKYFNVPVDHFSMTDNRTFPLRYLINDTFWEVSIGPIFFYAGNEGDIEMFAQNTGFLWETAQHFQALVVFAEHRYYGRSSPFEKIGNNTEFFSYLSSSQAIADFIDLIHELKNYEKSGRRYKRSNGKRSNPTIVFGGSYGGMLAAWMRMKYPAVVEGALASSAPILQFTNMTACDSFNRILTNVYNQSSPSCVKNIRNSWAILRETLSKENGRKWINDNWKLCQPIITEHNATRMIDYIYNIYQATGMVNYPYASDFLVPLPANPVNEICTYLDDDSLSDKPYELLDAVYNAISIYINNTGRSNCFEWSSDVYGDVDISLWNIQACTEIVMPFCSNGVTDMFEPYPWDFIQFSNECYNTYNVTPKEQYIEKLYGGKDLRYSSNIIFSNGLLDPYSGGGVTNNVSPSNVVVLIPDAAHHLDLRAENPADPPSVVRARKLYVNIFRRWIRNYRKSIKMVNKAD